MTTSRDDSRRAPAAQVEELYREHRTLVLAVCRGYLRDHVEADDAAQQTFLSAQRALANGSLPRDPAAWLATIARNECFARLRSRSGRPTPVDEEPPGTGPDAHADAVRRETVGELRAALADLPRQQREAILLREVRGLSYDEVAASMAVSTAAVESLIFRARRRLQLRLREVAAALTPAALLDPLRELLARLGATGLAAPAAAKLTAVGLGAAVVAGGVTADPHLIGLGHAPARHARTVSHPPARHAVAAQHSPAAAPQPPPAPAVVEVAAAVPLRVNASHEDGADRKEGPARRSRERSDDGGEDRRVAPSTVPIGVAPAATTAPATTAPTTTSPAATSDARPGGERESSHERTSDRGESAAGGD